MIFKYFSHSVACLFTLLIIFLVVQKILVRHRPTDLFCFCRLCFRCHLQDVTAVPTVMKLSSYVFFPESHSLSLIFKSLSHFEFICVYYVRYGFDFILLHVDIQFSLHHLLTGPCPFPI